MNDPIAKEPPRGGHPIDDLAAEHRLVLDVLAAAEREVERLAAGTRFDAVFWPAYADWLANFADHCHHEKEERVLFEELERAGFRREAGPTRQLRAEHDAMRSGSHRLAELLTGDDRAAIVRCVRDGIDHLRAHIAKEDEMLFPLARQILDRAALGRMRAGFHHVEDEVLGAHARNRYDELARTLIAVD